MHDLVRDLNATYVGQPALWSRDSDPDGFQWIDANDAANNTFSFLRWHHDGSAVACIANFAGMPHEGYRIGLPSTGQWTEILNTDAGEYGGSGVGNLGAVDAAARVVARPARFGGRTRAAARRAVAGLQCLEGVSSSMSASAVFAATSSGSSATTRRSAASSCCCARRTTAS